MKWRETKRGQLATKAGELSSHGKHKDALCLLDQAIEIEPEDHIILVYRGRVLASLERYDEAEHSFRRSLEIRDDLVYAWNELGFLLKDRERYEEAAECLRTSVSLEADYNTYTMLASVEMMFDKVAALSNAQKALKINPDWDEAIEIRDEAIAAIASIRPK